MNKVVNVLFIVFFSLALNAQNYSKYNTILSRFVSSKGTVNYKGLSTNKTILNSALNEFKNTKASRSWNNNQKKAFWMNAYNAYTLKLIIDNYPTSSIKKLHGGKPWDKKIANIGGKLYSLNQIEHEILRKYGDPRIHVGINCASVSCPKLHNKAFTSSNVESELEKLTKIFINDVSRNKITKSSVKISKIFEWFKDDFKSTGVIGFINEYSNVKADKKAKISYLKYDWNLND